MNYQITVHGGRLEFFKVQGGRMVLGDDDQRKHFMTQFRRAVTRSVKDNRLNATAQVIMPPIRKVAEHLEWSQHFFIQEDYDAYDVVRIAQDEYTAVAFFTSPDGQVYYTRPYREYTTVDWRTVKVGIEIPWDADRWGWPVVSKKMMEAAEELARKRDDFRKPLLDSAAQSQAGHVPTVATSMTKASVDSIISSAAGDGFPITQVAINIEDMMDMTGWTLPSDSIFGAAMPERIGNEVLTKLYFNGYGGLTWITNHTIPSGYAYFSGPPSQIGYQFMSGIRQASDTNIHIDVDYHNWRQSVAATVEGPHNLWRLQIT